MILLTPSDDIQHGSPRTVVARVEEISAWQSSALQLRGHAELILVQHAHANRPASKYRMPYIDLSGKYYLVQPAVCDSLYDPDARACANLVVLSLKQSLLCAVNVQHDCVSNGCKDTGIRHVRQERTLTTQTKPRIEHVNHSDLILNTAQMRSAVFVQPFRLDSPELNDDAIIMQAVAQEIDSRKAQVAVPAQGTRSSSGHGRSQGGRRRGQTSGGCGGMQAQNSSARGDIVRLLQT